MATNPNPVPSYAQVVLFDENAKDTKELLRSAKFNPVWLKWMLDLSVQTNAATGAIVGPASAADGDIVLFDGTTGRLAKDSGTLIASLVPTSRTVAGKALTGNVTLATTDLSDVLFTTWTPNQGAGLAVVGAFSSVGRATKIGQQVFLEGYVAGATSVAAGGGGAVICSNLPYAVNATTYAAPGVSWSQTAASGGFVAANASTLYSGTAIGATTFIYFTVTYSV